MTLPKESTCRGQGQRIVGLTNIQGTSRRKGFGKGEREERERTVCWKPKEANTERRENEQCHKEVKEYDVATVDSLETSA